MTFVFADSTGRVLLEIDAAGKVTSEHVDAAGDAGRIFLRSIENKLRDWIRETDRPAVEKTVEWAYDSLQREIRARRILVDPEMGEKYVPGLIVACRILAEQHPDKEWRMRH